MTEENSEFFDAFLAMQAELPVIAKNAENSHFHNKFADLATIVTTVRPILAKHGFVIIQQPGIRVGNGDPILSTILRHKSGYEMRSEMLLCLAKNDPQGQGSALTYARRYALSTILGIVTDEDDDGNAASGTSTPQGAAGVTVRREPPRQTQSISTTAPEDF